MAMITTALILTALTAAKVEAFPQVAPYRLVGGDTPPTVDGHLEEGIWRQAALVDEFHQIQPQDHGPPSEHTEVRLAYDEDYFYLGVNLYDGAPDEIIAKGLIQGQDFRSDDRFEVRFDTFNDRRNAFFFQVNANGIRRDGLVGNDYNIDEWDTVWLAQAQRQPWGWSAEFAIPFKSVSFDPGTDTWGLNFSRVIPRKGEEVTWSSAERRLTPAVSGYANGLSGMQQGRGIELAPALALRDQRNGAFKVEPELTGFYRITPFLTGALTLNTDFSATEVDDRRVNLSRFSLFFPEKRDFFLQDASIFEFGSLSNNGRPFFSRRIGLAGDGTPLDIRAGAKLTGRVGQWNIGSLVVNQQSNLDGASENLFVARASHNLLTESSLGAIVTYGDPSSARSNALGGFDFNYRDSAFLGERTLQTNLWYQRSATNGLDGDEAAYGLRVDYPNDRIEWSAEYRHIGEDFNPALGFVSRTGVETTNGQLRYRHRMSGGRLNWLGTRIRFFHSQRLSGGLQSASATYNVLEGSTSTNDFFSFFLDQERENLVEPFEIVDGITIPVGRYQDNRYGVFFRTGRQRPLSLLFEVKNGDFFDGRNRTIEMDVDWRPSPHFFGSLGYEVNRVELPQGDFSTRLVSARANVAINAEWSWLNLLQFDNLSNEVGINSRLRWIPSPDREYFLVLNKNLLRTPDDHLQSLDRQLNLKLNFNFRF